jgi:hypothetical protein
MVVVARGGDDKHNPGPDGRIEGEVEAENEPTGNGQDGDPVE